MTSQIPTEGFTLVEPLISVWSKSSTKLQSVFFVFFFFFFKGGTKIEALYDSAFFPLTTESNGYAKHCKNGCDDLYSWYFLIIFVLFAVHCLFWAGTKIEAQYDSAFFPLTTESNGYAKHCKNGCDDLYSWYFLIIFVLFAVHCLFWAEPKLRPNMIQLSFPSQQNQTAMQSIAKVGAMIYIFVLFAVHCFFGVVPKLRPNMIQLSFPSQQNQTAMQSIAKVGAMIYCIFLCSLQFIVFFWGGTTWGDTLWQTNMDIENHIFE